MRRTHVEDSEIVYRRILNNPSENAYRYKDGKLIISANAFRDPLQEPSVDRAKLCGNNPLCVLKKHPRDGVVELLVKDVRGIKITTFDKKQRPINQHDTDVEHRPTRNPAHSVIRTIPKFPSDKGFNRLKEKLALLASEAGFVIAPERERQK